jgi:hypothetical protein
VGVGSDAVGFGGVGSDAVVFGRGKVTRYGLV